jgi:hypothetical protein
MGAQPNKFCPEKALTKMAFCLPMVVPPTQEENAMNRFTQRFADAIVSTLGCFDRVIFKGYLPFGGDAQLNRFVDHGLKMRRKDFLPLVEQQSQALVDHAKAMAQSSGAPYERITGMHSKEKLIQDIIRQRRLEEGLVAVLCVMETCRTVKLIHGFYHYQVVARAANNRYLDALAVVDPPQASLKQLDRVSKPAKFHGRRRRALNLLHAEEQKLFLAVLRGEHRLQGIRNRDVALQLFGPVPSDPATKHQRTARVSRLLQLLRAHGLIAKVPHAHRYHVTAKGENLMNAAIYVRYKAFPKELQDVA